MITNTRHIKEHHATRRSAFALGTCITAFVATLSSSVVGESRPWRAAAHGALAGVVAAQPGPQVGGVEKLLKTEEDFIRLALMQVLVDNEEYDPFADTPPRANAKELDRMARVLKLDEEQRVMAEALLEGCLIAMFEMWKSSMGDFENRFRDAEADPEEAAEYMREMQPKMEAMMRTGLEMLTTFQGDLLATLEEEQAARWPIYAAGVARRAQTAMLQQPASVRVNLDEVARAIEPPVDDDLERLVEQQVVAWTTDVDVHVRALIQMSIDDINEMSAWMNPDEEGALEQMEKAQERWRERVLAAIDIGKATEQYYQQIRGLLPPESAAHFELDYHREAMPKVFAPTRAEKFMDEVEMLDSLRADQAEQLDRMRTEHQSITRDINLSYAAVDNRVIEAIADIDPTMIAWGDVDTVVQMREQAAQWDTTIDLDELEDLKTLVRNRRSLLERKQRATQAAVDQVAGLLTPEQLVEVPAPVIRPPDTLMAVLQRLRMEIMGGTFNASTDTVEFEGGVIRIKDRIAYVEYDQQWLDEGNRDWGGNVHDLDFSDDISPPRQNNPDAPDQ